MIKTGWQMEWENEVRYAAPIRIHMLNMNRSMRSATVAMRVLTERFKQAGVNLQKFSSGYRSMETQRKLLDQHKRRY